MLIVRTIAVVIGFLMGAWLAYDGMRALVTGNYTTPRAGPYAGQLGPWAQVVSRLGLEPRGTMVKAVHVGLGVIWCLSSAFLWARAPIGFHGLVIVAVCTLWYLPIGTAAGLLEIGLLIWLRCRAGG